MTEGVVWASRILQGRDVATARKRLESLLEELHPFDMMRYRQAVRSLRRHLEEATP